MYGWSPSPSYNPYIQFQARMKHITIKFPGYEEVIEGFEEGEKRFF